MSETQAAHRWPIRVYYEDTDFSGVVYHANYLRFFERGRTELLRAAGIHQSALHERGESGAGAFVVRSMTIDFKASARMDDLLTVASRVTMVGGASVTMAQAILRDDVPLVSATARIGLVAGGRALRLPAELRRRLSSAGGL